MKTILLTVCFLIALNIVSAQNCDCGRAQNGRNSNPWAVHIDSFITTGRTSCGAFLINNQYVLAPHHCIGTEEDVMTKKSKATAVIRTNDNNEMKLNIVDFQPLPSFDTLVNMALLKLERPVNLDDVTPICLPNNQMQLNDLKLLVRDYPSENLVAKPALLYDTEKCKAEFLNSQFRYQLENDKFCIDGVKRYACEDGTSQGIMTQTVEDKTYAAGLFAFTVCSTPNLKDGFTMISDYVQQIREMTSDAQYCN